MIRMRVEADFMTTTMNPLQELFHIPVIFTSILLMPIQGREETSAHLPFLQFLHDIVDAAAPLLPEIALNHAGRVRIAFLGINGNNQKKRVHTETSTNSLSISPNHPCRFLWIAAKEAELLPRHDVPAIERLDNEESSMVFDDPQISKRRIFANVVLLEILLAIPSAVLSPDLMMNGRPSVVHGDEVHKDSIRLQHSPYMPQGLLIIMQKGKYVARINEMIRIIGKEIRFTQIALDVRLYFCSDVQCRDVGEPLVPKEHPFRRARRND